ncbi:MAG TPA: TerC family protein [Fibrobacteria bacterium]|nr:TerC family protein [Fibrobacteria bacterium]
MQSLSDPQIWISLLTLTFLEIVLGIDNIVFISILAGKLPKERQPKARQLGLAAALITRLMLLASLAWIVKLINPLFTVLGQEISGRDLVLILGGLFLLYKSTVEIHEKVTHEEDMAGNPTGDNAVAVSRKKATFAGVIVQIMILDIIFSLDSVITAVGMVSNLGVMVAAVIIAVFIMLFAVNPISHFVNEYPTIKMLALSFLLLVGVALVGEGLDLHIPKGYIYFAMFFSMMVEILNIQMSKRRRKTALKQGAATDFHAR